MVEGTCPRCRKELSVDEYSGYEGMEKKHFTPLFLPIFGKCDCGENYAITTDCDDEYDAVLIIDFYEFLD